jgi:microcompartment protein CcmK/EutM
VHNHRIKDQDCAEQHDVSAAPNVTRLVQRTQKSQKLAEQVLVMVNAVETQKNQGGKEQ